MNSECLQNVLLERMYGKSLTSEGSNINTFIVETPELLSVQEHAERIATSQEQPQAPASELPVTPTTPLKGPLNKQIETRTSDGKRRITPMYIPPAPDTG